MARTKEQNQAIYARRDARAKAAGYQSYQHEYTAKKLGRYLEATGRLDAYDVLQYRLRQMPANVRETYRKGAQALIEKDHKTADRLGRKIPKRFWVVKDIPESAFYYHS